MIITIPGYCLGYRIASLAKCDDVGNNLLIQKLDVLKLSENALTLMPQNTLVSDDAEVLYKFNCCDDYDVFEISEGGQAYQYYSNESEDNSFLITGKCNSNCIMCPATENMRRKGRTSSIDNLLKIVNHIPSDVMHLTITGGEPFLVGTDIFTLFEAMKNKFVYTGFLLLTNGRVFAKAEYCLRLAESLPQQTVIGIPLHGYDPQSHDTVTQTQDSFLQTTVGLKNLLALGMNIELRVVISNITAPYLEKIAKLIIHEFYGIKSVKFIGLEMLGNAAINSNIVWIPYMQAFKSARNAILLLVNRGIDVGIYNFPLCSVEKSFWPICLKSITDYKVRYSDKCNCCVVRDACGGLFAGTYRLAECDLKPVVEE